MNAIKGNNLYYFLLTLQISIALIFGAIAGYSLGFLTAQPEYHCL